MMWASEFLLWMAGEASGRSVWPRVLLSIGVIVAAFWCASAIRSRVQGGQLRCRRCAYPCTPERPADQQLPVRCAECGADLTRRGAAVRGAYGTRWGRLVWAGGLTCLIGMAWWAGRAGLVSDWLRACATECCTFEEAARIALEDDGERGDAARAVMSKKVADSGGVLTRSQLDCLERILSETDWWGNGTVPQKRFVQLAGGLEYRWFQYVGRYSGGSKPQRIDVLSELCANSPVVEEHASDEMIRSWGALFQDVWARLAIDSATGRGTLTVRMTCPPWFDVPCGIVGAYTVRLVSGGTAIFDAQIVLLPRHVVRGSTWMDGKNMENERAPMNDGPPPKETPAGVELSWTVETGLLAFASADLRCEFHPLELPFVIGEAALASWRELDRLPTPFQADANSHVIEHVSVVVDGLPLKAWLELQAAE